MMSSVASVQMLLACTLIHLCISLAKLALPVHVLPAQVTRKLLLKSLGAFKSATKAGTSEMNVTEKPEGMVKALTEMALFCDRALQAEEDGHATPLDTEVSYS